MRWRVVAAALAGLALGFLALAWWFSPRVVAWQPADGLAGPAQQLVVRLNVPLSPSGVEGSFSVEPAVEGEWLVDGRQVIFQPALSWTYGQSYTVTMAGGARGQNGLPSLLPARHTFRFREPLLLFLREEEDVVNVWSWEPALGEQPLTAEPLGVWDYASEPDGLGIVVSAHDGDGSDDLVWLGWDGSRRTLLNCTASRCRAARGQPLGSLLAFERRPLSGPADQTEVWLLDRRTGQLQPAMDDEALAILPGASRQSRAPRWSADGRWLAFFQPEARVIVLREIGGQGEILFIPANMELMGEWSPTAPRLAYTVLAFGIEEDHTHEDEQGVVFEHNERGLYEHLVVSDLTARESVDLSERLEVRDGLPDWSPDGLWLAVTRSSTGAGRQVWLVDAWDGRGRALTDDPFHHHSSVAWSPDGALLAFMRAPVADPVASSGIWLIDLPDGEPRLLLDEAFLPAWLP
jgi:hypothetical protein